MTAPAVEVRGLRKAYGPVEAVRGIDFAVARGEVFALLGPNGAGKTTTVEILEGYRRPDGGSVRVLGLDPATAGRSLRARVGIVLQGSGVYPYLTPREALELFAGYYPRPRPVPEVLDLVGLGPEADRLVRGLSGGQVRRLDVALALVGGPELIFLDEPTTGFDPGARRAAWDVVASLAATGVTVLLTTHYMDEAQALADRVAVLREGRIVAMGAPADLGDPTAVQIRFDRPAAAEPEALARLCGGRLLEGGNGRVAIAVGEPTEALHRLTGWSLAHDVPLGRLEVARPTLEDVYLSLTTAEADAAAADVQR